MQYRIKWLGYSDKQSTWEPIEYCKNCEDKIYDFENENLAKRESTAEDWVVEAIRDWRIRGGKVSLWPAFDKKNNLKINWIVFQIQYKIHWKGCGAKEDSWEPVGNCYNAIPLIAEFELGKGRITGRQTNTKQKVEKVKTFIVQNGLNRSEKSLEDLKRTREGQDQLIMFFLLHAEFLGKLEEYRLARPEYQEMGHDEFCGTIESNPFKILEAFMSDRGEDPGSYWFLTCFPEKICFVKETTFSELRPKMVIDFLFSRIAKPNW